MARILTGKEVTEALDRSLLERVARLCARGITPCLSILRVGERPDDLAYEKGAEKRAEKLGIRIRKCVLPETASQEELLLEIRRINEDPGIHGLLLFRPLPKGMDDNLVRNALSPEKDVDGITDLSQAGVFTGSGRGFSPCTAEAVMELLSFYQIELPGKNAAVIGRSQVIGKPVAMLLLQKNATVTLCHSRSENLAEICREKDLIISAAGHAGMVTRDFLSAGQVVIDVAINFDQNDRLCGDVDFEAAQEIVSAITPVPRGVGGITPSILMKHVVEIAEGFASGEKA